MGRLSTISWKLLTLFAFGEEIRSGGEDGEDASDDRADAGDDPTSAEGIIVSLDSDLFGRLGGTIARNLKEDEDATNDKSDEGDEIQETGEFVERGDFEEGKNGAKKKNDDADDDKNEGNDGASSGINGPKINRDILARSSYLSAENTIDAGNFGAAIPQSVNEGWANHQKDEGDDRNYGCNQTGEL